MRKYLFMPLFLLLVTGCVPEEPDLTEVAKELPDGKYLLMQKDDELGMYAKDVSYEVGEEVYDAGDLDYNINFIMYAKDSFDNLEKREQLSMMGHFEQGYLSGLVSCGKPVCVWGDLIVKTSANEYVLTFNSIIGERVLETKGEEDEYTWTQLREENREIIKAKEYEIRKK